MQYLQQILHLSCQVHKLLWIDWMLLTNQIFHWVWCIVINFKRKVLTEVFSWCVINWFYFPWNVNLGNYLSWLVTWRFCVTREDLDLQLVFMWRHHQNPKLKSHNNFIHIRHKGISTYICLQLLSSIACLVWKPGPFEVQSYGVVWHTAPIAFVEKYTLT